MMVLMMESGVSGFDELSSIRYPFFGKMSWSMGSQFSTGRINRFFSWLYSFCSIRGNTWEVRLLLSSPVWSSLTAKSKLLLKYS